MSGRSLALIALACISVSFGCSNYVRSPQGRADTADHMAHVSALLYDFANSVDAVEQPETWLELSYNATVLAEQIEESWFKLNALTTEDRDDIVLFVEMGRVRELHEQALALPEFGMFDRMEEADRTETLGFYNARVVEPAQELRLRCLEILAKRMKAIAFKGDRLAAFDAQADDLVQELALERIAVRDEFLGYLTGAARSGAMIGRAPTGAPTLTDSESN